MKTKTKTLVVVEIAIVLCSVFLVAIPAIAADQTSQKVSANTITTASEDDYVLGIYGNANEDDTIDMGDVVYTKLAIFGKKSKTELCDAKYDGRINVLDVIQTKLIILGKEKELTVIDSLDRIVTVKKPVQRIVASTHGILELARAVKLEKDRVVGVGSYTRKGEYKMFFPEYQDKPLVGVRPFGDAESILKLDPDLVILLIHHSPQTQKVLEAAGIPVFGAYGGAVGGDAGEEAIKLGYIFDKQDEAEKFRDWYWSITNLIEEKVKKIAEEDKPKVYFETFTKYSTTDETRCHVARTGGKNIFEGMSGKVDPEAVVKRNPDIIIRVTSHLTIDKGEDGYDMDVGDIAKLKEIRDEIMSRPELQTVTAVKEGRVYILSSYIISWRGKAGCRSFLQDIYQTKWLHPELFEDIDPKPIHQEYLTRFQGLDIDLDEKGVFAYPEPS